ncbi:MAG: UDP-N-acetylmuramoyl-L-alanyl-D-glutamate--2,6-diaminopimelate ligase [bacterium]
MKTLIRKFIPDFLLSWYHFFLAFLGALLYRFPSMKIKVIGVTGTNGKTTVVNFTTKILETAGFKVASLSSIKFKIGDKESKNTLKMTMPGRFKLQKFLRQAVSSKCQYALLEVTSEGIVQHRHKFINFEAAVFTNLTPEHIEAHRGFDNYRRAKRKLFQAANKIHVINMDDENARYFLQFPAKKKYLYQFKNQNEKCKITIENSKISKDIDDFTINLKLLGKFNIYNSLAAICVGLSQRVNLEVAKRAVETIEGVPGRMEEVISVPFKVFVDYAFTPNALEQVYKTLKPSQGKMIAVLGSCGGGRDKWKRPVLGKIAAKYCDRIIITNEDPYDEDPLEIIDQVASGIKNYESGIMKILDRRGAIRESLRLARPGDTVIITGKGCEPWIIEARGKKIPWDDREVVKEEFRKLSATNDF